MSAKERKERKATLSKEQKRTLRGHVMQIHKALQSTPVTITAVLASLRGVVQIDVPALRSLAHLGFVNNGIRSKVWPALLGAPETEPSTEFSDIVVERHRYTDQ
jgi:hypothetical protein